VAARDASPNRHGIRRASVTGFKEEVESARGSQRDDAARRSVVGRVLLDVPIEYRAAALWLARLMHKVSTERPCVPRSGGRPAIIDQLRIARKHEPASLLMAMFLVFLVGQVLSGRAEYNAEQQLTGNWIPARPGVRTVIATEDVRVQTCSRWQFCRSTCR
jgi:hypothetical protein